MIQEVFLVYMYMSNSSLPANLRSLLNSSRVGALTRSQSSTARSAGSANRTRGRRGRRGRATAATASAATPIGPVTYVSAWVTRNGPSRVANARQPHRLYAFTNSNGHTVYISNQNIRNPLSGMMGRNPPPTNNNYRQRLVRLSILRHPRYISNMIRNIISARERARSGVLSARRRRQPTRNEVESNKQHNKQLDFWRQIKRVVNAMPNSATRINGNVTANVRSVLESRRHTIKHG